MLVGFIFCKKNTIDWKIFDKQLLVVSDIYSRENNKLDKISSEDFLESCYKKK
jgi:hypothetical protein